MAHHYDLIVIGAGSGGLGMSLFAAKIGLKTLLVERADEHIGGDCLNDGCVPSKALIHLSRIMHNAGKARAFGLEVSGSVDVQKVMQYVYDKQSVIRKHENAEFLRGEGMDVELGWASFHSNNEVTVNGKVFQGRRIVLATGSRPSSLHVPGVEHVTQYNNESVFDLKHLPKKMLVVGGGPIGIEIGQALHRLGVDVIVVHQGNQILPQEPPDIAQLLQASLTKEGITFFIKTQVKKFSSSHEAVLYSEGRGEYTIDFDAVFVAVGRSIVLDGLHLEKAGVEVKDGRIITDDYLRTTNKTVYLCGDVAGSLKFSHAAEQHVRLLLNNIFSPLKKKLNNDHMSWVTFSDPQVATFGLSPATLRERNVRFDEVSMDFHDDDRAVVDDYENGKLKLYLSKGKLLRSPKILGGSMIAPDAGELIQELILANPTGLSVDAIFNKIYPYPRAARVNQLLIVKEKEKQLTAFLKKVLRGLYKLFN